ncbi:AlpA family phage regulatory protein [Ensifer sp. IC3342]|nr:AlpA family phage regulatory protein [Ensifer sp. BRP08]MCA1445068.1 AlpA family phage regulatory protein [Ensifer sp. IC3342]
MFWDDMTGLLTRRQVSELTTLSRTTLWRYVDGELFPEPRRTPGGRLVWWVADVHRWMHELPPGGQGARGRWEKLAEGRARRAPAQQPAVPPVGPGSAPSGPAREGHR